MVGARDLIGNLDPGDTTVAEQVLVCASCQRRYGVQLYDSEREYKCLRCRGALEVASGSEAATPRHNGQEHESQEPVPTVERSPALHDVDLLSGESAEPRLKTRAGSMTGIEPQASKKKRLTIATAFAVLIAAGIAWLSLARNAQSPAGAPRSRVEEVDGEAVARLTIASFFNWRLQGIRTTASAGEKLPPGTVNLDGEPVTLEEREAIAGALARKGIPAVGMTRDELVAALGQPSGIRDAGMTMTWAEGSGGWRINIGLRDGYAYRVSRYVPASELQLPPESKKTFETPTGDEDRGPP